jgi:hypothetical protein
MISREELIPKLSVGMKLQYMFSRLDPTDELILTVQNIDPVNFVLYLTKDNGARIIKPLGAPYKYEIDDKYFQIFHNDRTSGWQPVEKYKIITEA